MPELEAPLPSATPTPVQDAVGTVTNTVNNAVGGVEDTVNGTAGGAQDTVNRATGDSPVAGRPATDPGGSTAPGGTSPISPGTASGGGSSSTRANGGGRNGRSGAAGGRRGDRRGGRGRGGRTGRGGSATPAAAGATSALASTGDGTADDEQSAVARVIERIQEVIPGPVKALIALLALIAAGLAVRTRITAVRARRLERQREQLLDDVGLLQRALLPDLPPSIRGLDVSVAYRPADDGPAAGGDFYDVFELEEGRTAIIVGDVCGHGRAALAVTALMRYTLRAYLGAGFEPRVALQVAGKALAGDPESALTTVVLAIYDPEAGTLTYACAGHEAPIVLGPGAYEPVTTLSSPPVGGFMATGHRQTTIPLPPEATACFFTDGLVEARLGDDLMGRERLTELVSDIEPDGGAKALLERVAAKADHAPDDMAACIVRARESAQRPAQVRIEELEADARDLDGSRVAEFLVECGVDRDATAGTIRAARAKAAEFEGAVIRVFIDGPMRRVEVTPRPAATLHVPSLEGPRRRAALEVPV